MLGLLSAIIGMFFYSAENVMIEGKLSDTDSIRLFIFFYIASIAAFIPLALVLWLARERLGVDFTPPSAPQWSWIFACVAAEFLADFFWFKAYNLGASVTATVTILSFAPVAAVALDVVVSGAAPSFRQIVGCAMAPFVIYLVSRE